MDSLATLYIYTLDSKGSGIRSQQKCHSQRYQGMDLVDRVLISHHSVTDILFLTCSTSIRFRQPEVCFPRTDMCVCVRVSIVLVVLTSFISISMNVHISRIYSQTTWVLSSLQTLGWLGFERTLGSSTPSRALSPTCLRRDSAQISTHSTATFGVSA